MFVSFVRTVVLAIAVAAGSLASAAPLSVQSELLCSPEGLMRLVSQFNVKGQFTIPDPNADLQTFLSAQQGLLNAIDMVLAQENMRQDPSDVGSLPSRPLQFASRWQYRGLLAAPDLRSWAIPVGSQWSANARQAIDHLLDREYLPGSRHVDGHQQKTGSAPQRDDHPGTPLAM